MNRLVWDMILVSSSRACLAERFSFPRKETECGLLYTQIEYIYSAWDQINSVLLIKYIIIIHCKCMNNGPLWNISYAVNVRIIVNYRAQPACKLERGDSGWGHDESSFWYAGPQNDMEDTDSVKILQIQYFCWKILSTKDMFDGFYQKWRYAPSNCPQMENFREMQRNVEKYREIHRNAEKCREM